MKRILALLLIAFLALGTVTGCGAPDESVETDIPEEIGVKNEEPKATPKPTLEPINYTIGETTLVDDENCSFVVKKVDPDDWLGFAVVVQCENKTDKTLMFALDDASVMGYMNEPLWAEEVTAGNKAISTISFSNAVLEDCGITAVDEITFKLRVYDSDDWSADELVEEWFTIYPTEKAPKSIVYPEYRISDDAHVVADNEGATFAILSADPNGDWGYTLNCYLENKTESTLMFAWENVSVMGYMADPFWATSVAPGKVKLTEINFNDSTLERCGITSVDEIVFGLRIYDEDDWLGEKIVDESFITYPTGMTAETVAYPVRKPVDSEQVIVDDENCAFIIESVDPDGDWGYTLNCYLENKCDFPVMFAWDEVSVNGFMVDPFWASTVDAGKRAYVEISFSDSKFEENYIDAVTEIAFTLRVTNEENWNQVLEEVFTYDPNGEPRPRASEPSIATSKPAHTTAPTPNPTATPQPTIAPTPVPKETPAPTEAPSATTLAPVATMAPTEKPANKTVANAYDRIFAGGEYLVWLRSDGTVTGAGYLEGHIKELKTWTDIVDIAVASSHTLGLRSDGTVVAIGPDAYSAAGMDDIVSIAVGRNHTVAVHENGTASLMGYSSRLVKSCFEEFENITQVSIGSEHSAAMNADGQWFVAGSRVDDKDSLGWQKPLKKIVCGAGFTLGLGEDGTVQSTGANNYGQINTSEWTDIVDVDVGTAHSVGLRSDGTVVATGDNSKGQCDVQGWTDIVSIVCGDYFTAGICADGRVLMTPKSSAFDGVDTWKLSSVCGYENSSSVQKGVDGTEEKQAKLVKPENFVATFDDTVGTMNKVLAAGGGGYGKYVIGIKEDGSVVAAGETNKDACKVDDWSDIISISASTHTVGLRRDGTVVAVGTNGAGECRVDDWTNIVAIAAGGQHTVGLRADGTVIATGYNAYGQCDVENWADIVAVAAGGNHTVGLKEDGTVIAIGKDWGNGNPCDVADWTNIVAIDAQGDFTVGLKSDGSVITSELFSSAMNSWKNIVSIAMGRHHLVGIDANGVVWVVDLTNQSRELTEWTDVVAVAAGADGSMYGLKADGTVITNFFDYYDSSTVASWTNIRLPGDTAAAVTAKPALAETAITKDIPAEDNEEPLLQLVSESSETPAHAEKTIEQTGTEYVVNKGTGKFHYPRCSSVNDMKESNKWFYVGTREDLISRGYSPCGRCHP